MTHLGLFEGIGGFSLAGRWAGWETVAWCEWDKHCHRVLKYHFPNAIPHDDITKTDFTKYAGQIDVLTGGFPCQPYSTAGKRLGKEDDRHLWPEMLRAVREVRPRWVVGENVRGLVSWNGGMVFDEVQADLEAEGYEVAAFILPACAVDAPHRRDRVWFVAYRGAHDKKQRKCEVGRVWAQPVTLFDAKNTQQIRCDSSQPESKPGEREQREFGAGNNVRFSDAANAEPFGSYEIHDKIQQKLAKGWRTSLSFRELDASNANKVRLQGQESIRKLGRIRLGMPGQIGDWQQFPTQPSVCGGDDGIPRKLDAITFPKWREFSIGAYGNAIVPQVAFQIFKAINQYEQAQQPDSI